MVECIGSLVELKLFTTLKANSGYWQAEMDEKVVNRTAFLTQNWLYKYIRISFGLKYDPIAFQTAMNVVLATVKL